MTGLAPLSYPAIALAAAIEGEAVFVAASALVGAGVLHPMAVVAAGALGAAVGDQVHFFAARGRLAAWLRGRADTVRGSQAVCDWVGRHHTLATAAVRFAPGLRIAITLLCATAGVPAWRFCLVNAITAVIWAAAVLQLVAYGGPRLLASTGLSPMAAAIWSGIAVVAVTAVATPVLRRTFRSATP